ncbi:hypothetical protein B0H11DRAFT_2019680, partial [Mycena galericulata]
MLDLEGAMNTSSFAHDPATTELFAYDPAFDSSLFAESNMLMPSSAPPDPLIPSKIFWICMVTMAGSLTPGPPSNPGRSPLGLTMSLHYYFLQPHRSRLLRCHHWHLSSIRQIQVPRDHAALEKKLTRPIFFTPCIPEHPAPANGLQTARTFRADLLK